MSQIKNKFVSSASPLDDSKIKLRNNNYLKARNAADSADVSIIKVNASDVIEFASFPEKSGTPSSANQLVNKSYVDSAVGASASTFEWQDSVIDQIATPPGSPSTGDRYLVIATATGAWAGQEDKIAEYNGSSWDFTTPTVGMAVSVDDETDGIYLYSGGAWSKKFFESTSASTGLVKVGMDIRIDSSAAGAGLDFAAGVLSVKLESSDPSLQISSDELGVKIDTARGLSKGASGLGIDVAAAGALEFSAGDLAVKLEASNPSLQISSNELGIKLYSGGAIVKGASGVGINLEATNPSLQISSNEVGVKFGASSGLAKDATGLYAKVHSGTVKINGSGEIEGIKPAKEDFTLTGTDITNQYVTLAQTPKASSVMLFIDGVMQDEGTDYSVTGAQIDFLGDLATGGNAALVSGDILHVVYMYL